MIAGRSMTAHLDDVHTKSRALLRSPLGWVRAMLFWGLLAGAFLISRRHRIPTRDDVVLGTAALAAACLVEFVFTVAVLVNHDLWGRWVNPRADPVFARKMFTIRAVSAMLLLCFVVVGYLIYGS